MGTNFCISSMNENLTNGWSLFYKSLLSKRENQRNFFYCHTKFGLHSWRKKTANRNDLNCNRRLGVKDWGIPKVFTTEIFQWWVMTRVEKFIVSPRVINAWDDGQDSNVSHIVFDDPFWPLQCGRRGDVKIWDWSVGWLMVCGKPYIRYRVLERVFDTGKWIFVIQMCQSVGVNWWRGTREIVNGLWNIVRGGTKGQFGARNYLRDWFVNWSLGHPCAPAGVSQYAGYDALKKNCDPSRD